MRNILLDYKWWLIGGFTLAHFITALICAGVSFSLGMSHFDRVIPETFTEHITTLGADVLMFPLDYLINKGWLPDLNLGVFDDLPVVANSVLWAVCCYGVLRVISMRRKALLYKS